MSQSQIPYPDEDRGANLAAAYIAGCAISLVFVAMRLCARYSIAGVGMDDWCMLVTWVSLKFSILLSPLSLVDCFPPTDDTYEHLLLLWWNTTSGISFSGSRAHDLRSQAKLYSATAGHILFRFQQSRRRVLDPPPSESHVYLAALEPLRGVRLNIHQHRYNDDSHLCAM